MRLRTPWPKEAIVIGEEAVPASKNQITSYKVKVITPIYGGGVQAGKPDKGMPIRASAVRGQLRYWWRFLQSHGGNALRGKDLFIKERETWGGMGEESERKEKVDRKKEDFSSKVFIQVKDVQRAGNIKPCCEYSSYRDNNNQIKYRLRYLHDIPQYALFPAQGKKPDAQNYNEEKDKPHNVILPGATFQLKIDVDKSISKVDRRSILEAVRWWASFGGIGARTRRGAGSVEVKDIDSVAASEVEKYGCVLRQNNANGAMQAWNTAIAKLQQFRQGVGVGRNQKKDNNGNPVTYGRSNTPAQGGSRWPEPDSIREITSRNSPKHNPTHPARLAFPRAAFGLPIIFKFNDNDERAGDPKQLELRPINSERMSSPLVLKAMATKNGYKAIALKLPTKFRSTPTLKLNGIPDKPNRLSARKENEWSTKNWERWPDVWWDETKASIVRPIHDQNASDPLDAFMNYFKPENGANK